MIYYKQEKYTLAEQHYLKALAINPKHSVLLCNLAVVSSPIEMSVLKDFRRILAKDEYHWINKHFQYFQKYLGLFQKPLLFKQGFA